MNQDIIRQVLSYGILAPSSHNSQPWRVQIEENSLKVFADFNRKLPFVDPGNRELLLSLSAFIETLSIAASAMGLTVEIQTNINEISESRELFVLEFKGTTVKADNKKLNLIENRFTNRKNYKTTALNKSDIFKLESIDAANIHYFPSDSIQGQTIIELQTLAFRKQSEEKNKQAELSNWLRFDKNKKIEMGDGIYPEMLGIEGLTKLIWYNFFNKKITMSDFFVNQSIRGTEKQVKNASGFLVITSSSAGNSSIYNSGRVYQKVLLKCTELKISNHTMSQILEETPMRNQIGVSLGLRLPIQFIIRTGYSDDDGYGKHIRRPIDSIIF